MSESIAAPSTEDIILLERNSQLPGFQAMSDLAGIVVDRALNAELWDIEGKRYIDFFTGVGVCAIGHSHPRYVRRLTDQLQRCIVGTFYTEVRSQYFELLRRQLPPGLDKIQMYSTGSEAVEAAIKLARAYTGRHEVLSFWGGFHGKTQAALSLHGGDRKHRWGPLMPGSHQAPYAYCYRCPLDLQHPSCEYACVDFVHRYIEHSTTGDLAAIIVEPVQGTNGNIIPPAGYLRELRALADRYGALMIVDEVITGFGRTGRMFAFEHEPAIAPDVVVLGKAMASGVPVSAIVSRLDLVESTPFGEPSAGASTFGGNPLASAASLATLEIVLEEDLVGRARRLGSAVAPVLDSWVERFPFVGNAANLGLMIGVELVEPGSKKPLRGDLTKQLFRELMDRGLLAMAYGSKIRIYPPLTVSSETLEEGLTTFEDALAAIGERLN